MHSRSPCGSGSRSLPPRLAPPKNLTRRCQIPTKEEVPIADREALRRAAPGGQRGRQAEACRAAGRAGRVVREPAPVVRRDPSTARRELPEREKVEQARGAARERGRVVAERAAPAQVEQARLAPAGPTRAEPTREGPTLAE